jgi:hypothetical protein
VLRKSLEGKEFTSEVEKLNESLSSIKGEEIPQLDLRMERIEETRGGVVNIYLTSKDSNLVK